MKKGKNRAVIMAMIGAIIGIMLSIVFSNSANMLVMIPVGKDQINIIQHLKKDD